MDKLEECPFCESVAVFNPDGDEEFDPRYWVECTNCAARGPECSLPERAIVGWNTRKRLSDASKMCQPSDEESAATVARWQAMIPTEDIRAALAKQDARTGHFWTGDGNRCVETGYDGPICAWCGVADINPPSACAARFAQTDDRTVTDKIGGLVETQRERERQEHLALIGLMMSKHVENWPYPRTIKTAIELIDKALTTALKPDWME